MDKKTIFAIFRQKVYNSFNEIGWFRRDNITWVKKTKFSKTEACLFIYHNLLINKRIKKDYLERVLETESRITLYNYITEIKIFIHNFQNRIGYIMELYYDTNTKEYVLSVRRKK